MTISKMFSLTEVAKLVDVSYWTVRRWVVSGKLKGIKLPGKWRIEEVELNKFLDKRRAK